MGFVLTKQARRRLEQRGIPETVIDLVLTFGRWERIVCESRRRHRDICYRVVADRRPQGSLPGESFRALSAWVGLVVIVEKPSHVVTAYRKERTR